MWMRISDPLSSVLLQYSPVFSSSVQQFFLLLIPTLSLATTDTQSFLVHGITFFFISLSKNSMVLQDSLRYEKKDGRLAVDDDILPTHQQGT